MNRRATVGELSASLAHELNQPLGSILTNAETAELIANSPSPDMAEIKEIMADIKRDDQRAAEIIRRLRNILKKAPSETKDFDLNEVVREVFDFLAVQAGARGVALSNVPAQQMLQVHGDRIQIQQVILNLILNGMEAMADAPAGQRKIIGRTCTIGRSLCRDIDLRFWPRYFLGRPGESIRSILYHQNGRHGHGAIHSPHHR